MWIPRGAEAGILLLFITLQTYIDCGIELQSLRYNIKDESPLNTIPLQFRKDSGEPISIP